MMWELIFASDQQDSAMGTALLGEYFVLEQQLFLPSCNYLLNVMSHRQEHLKHEK